MDTTTGRFTSMDSYLGSVNDPVSLHKYLYANANPVNYIDPSGYFSLAELMEVVKTQGVLSGITYLNVNTYLLYIKLESSVVGIIIKAVLDESFETLLEGNISLESIKWSAIEAIWKMAGVDVDLSVPKMIAESSESDRNTINLPEYDGKTTHGILVLDDGTQIKLVSGNGDPRYTNYRNNGHVEQKAALYMRENNISNATVYHNNTNGTCGYCNTMTATFLPEGATLTVVPPKNAVANNSRAIAYVKTYTGTSNDPKISSRYKGN